MTQLIAYAGYDPTDSIPAPCGTTLYGWAMEKARRNALAAWRAVDAGQRRQLTLTEIHEESGIPLPELRDALEAWLRA